MEKTNFMKKKSFSVQSSFKKIDKISLKKDSLGVEIPTRLFTRRTTIPHVVDPESIETDEIIITDL